MKYLLINNNIINLTEILHIEQTENLIDIYYKITPLNSIQIDFTTTELANEALRVIFSYLENVSTSNS